MGGKPKGSASLNPWEALFSSATRPRAVTSSYKVADETKKKDTSDVSSCKSTDISTTTNKGGYTILIQQSITPKSQRQYALSSTMAQNNNNTADNKSSNSKKGSSSTSLYTSLSSGISTMTINNRSHQQQQKSNAISISGVGYGISGPFLVRQSFDELSYKCNGAVIFVSTIGNSSILDMMECMSTNSGICDDDEMMVDDGYQVASGDDNDGKNTQHPLEKHRNAIQMFKRHGACVDLSSNPFGWDDDDDSDNIEGKNECDPFVHKCSMNKLQPIANAIRKAALSIESRRGISLEEQQRQQQSKKQQLHQPIPIVFESMTPLLNVHGVDKVCVLLKSLGRIADQSMMKNNIILLSPIVVPALYESLQPSEHRSLEDVSDAFVHLNLAANSSNSVHHHESSSSDSNSTSVMSGVMDLVRRGGSGGLGGKLIRHCIPFHIMRSVSNNTSSSMTMDARDDCYWILEHDEEEAAEDDDKKKAGSSVKSKKEMPSSTNQQQDSDTTAATSTSSRPRIFLQDDDPEYDDYDEEEDLDDDLDL